LMQHRGYRRKKGSARCESPGAYLVLSQLNLRIVALASGTCMFEIMGKEINT